MAILLGVLVGSVVAVLGLKYYKAQETPHFIGNYVIEGFETHPYLGYAPKAGTKLSSCKTVGNDTLYCAQYTIDDLGRRQMPLADSAKEHLMFFGCSYTYGEGVDNSQTFAYRLAAECPNYQVYNYAYSGYGPQQMLARLEFGQVDKEAPQASGYLIYMLLPEHVSRASGAPYYLQWWGSSSPHYALQGDSLVYYANHMAWRPCYTLLQRFLGWSGLGGILYTVPETYTDEDIALTVAILKASAAKYHALYPTGRFVVALPPITGQQASFSQLTKALGKARITVWDMHTAFDLQPPLAIAGDGHPSTQGHAELAKLLSGYCDSTIWAE